MNSGLQSTLLHQLDPQQPAWCSLRSWVIASALQKAGLDIAPAVETAAVAEFIAFLAPYQTLPDLVPTLDGKGDRTPFPKAPSAHYATAIGLTVRAIDATQAHNAFTYCYPPSDPKWGKVEEF